MSNKTEREKFGAKLAGNLVKGRLIYLALPGERQGDPEQFTNHMLMAPYSLFKHSPKNSVLIYGLASDTITGNVHKIVFDTVVDNPAGDELYLKGVVQAVISPLSEEEGMRAAWNEMKPMLFSKTARAAYLGEMEDWLPQKKETG
tara:strand:- start:255 stop:689 length:435 start_codon:yes stop_codon:yes gene_type:complete